MGHMDLRGGRPGRTAFHSSGDGGRRVWRAARVTCWSGGGACGLEDWSTYGEISIGIDVKWLVA